MQQGTQTHWSVIIGDTTNTQSVITTLLQVYLQLLHPRAEYAAPVQDPHHLSNINSLENVQKFTLCVCCKQWDTAYSELLSWSNVPSLENHHLYLKLCHLLILPSWCCALQHQSFSFIKVCIHCYNSLFCHTTSFRHSFVLDSVHTWNCLVEVVVMGPSLNSVTTSVGVFM